MIEGGNYSIDPEAQNLTFWLDRETDRKETASFSELVELLIWLKGRESVLRRLVFNADPLTIRRPMQPMGGFFVGMTEDRRPVKVRSERWQAVMSETERLIRKNWLEDQEDSRRLKAGPVVALAYDAKGQPMYTPPDVLTEADAPLALIQQEQYRRSQPEWWVDREDNLQLGQWAKLP